MFKSLVIIAVCILLGGFVLRLGWEDYQVAQQSKQWPTAQGTIQQSEVSSSLSGGKTMYGPHVVYTYMVNEQEYTGSMVRFSEGTSSSSSGARKTVMKYPVGTQVLVHYDPMVPSVAVLEAGANGWTYMLLAIGAVFCLGVPALVLFGGSKPAPPTV